MMMRGRRWKRRRRMELVIHECFWKEISATKLSPKDQGKKEENQKNSLVSIIVITNNFVYQS